MMASLALLLVTLFLVQASKSYKVAIYPMFFMYITTVCALFYTSFFQLIPGALSGKLAGAKVFGNLLAAAVAIVLIICALILAYDGWKAFKKLKAGEVAAPAGAEKAT